MPRLGFPPRGGARTALPPPMLLVFLPRPYPSYLGGRGSAQRVSDPIHGAAVGGAKNKAMLAGGAHRHRASDRSHRGQWNNK